MKEGALERYVTETLLPSLGVVGGDVGLDTITQGGTRSSVHVVRREGRPALLLRAFARRGRAARAVSALRHLEALGLPAPRLVACDLARWPRLLPGLRARAPYIVVETWIDGVRYSALSEPRLQREAALRIAALLARYHGVTRARWGRPDRGSVLPFAASAVREGRRMVRHLRSFRWLGPDEARHVSERLGSWKDVIAGIRTFNLTHNDANRHNFVRTASGEMIPVDLHRLAYRPFAEELVNALYQFCRKDASLVDPFLDAYFARIGETARRSFDATRGFFEALYFVRKMHRRSERHVPGTWDGNVEQWRRLVLAAAVPSPGAPRDVATGPEGR